MTLLTLEMLQVADGDALLLQYGTGENQHVVLIDGGRRSTYRAVRDRLSCLPVDERGLRRIDLLIVTHVDADHIEGVICLLQDSELACDFGDIWFNDWTHLEPLAGGLVLRDLGPEQGEFLGALIRESGHPWNRAFDGRAAVVPRGEEPLPTCELPGGMKLTILSPTIDALIELRATWSSAIEAAGFQPGDYATALEQFADKRWAPVPRDIVHLGDEAVPKTLDHKEANGSSIGVLAEWGDIRFLLAGDAWPQVLRPNLARWRQACDPVPERVRLDGFKLAHHGSIKNVTPQLLDEIECPVYFISTNGARYHHPNVEAIEMILAHHHGRDKPRLLFNYRSSENEVWAKQNSCVALYEQDAVLCCRQSPHQVVGRDW